MLPDRVSNPGPLTYESGALPIALRGSALLLVIYCVCVLLAWKGSIKNVCCSFCFISHVLQISPLITDGENVFGDLGPFAPIFFPKYSRSSVARTLMACLPQLFRTWSLQSGLQDQKSVKFSHSVISRNQLLQNSKTTVNIFLTFRNHVKIFFSQDIMQNFLKCCIP